LFVMACKNAGFDLVSKGWEKKQNAIRFCCSRHLVVREKQKRAVSRLPTVITLYHIILYHYISQSLLFHS
jgi:hypothetical protein